MPSKKKHLIRISIPEEYIKKLEDLLNDIDPYKLLRDNCVYRNLQNRT